MELEDKEVVNYLPELKEKDQHLLIIHTLTIVRAAYTGKGLHSLQNYKLFEDPFCVLINCSVKLVNTGSKFASLVKYCSIPM